MRSGTSPPARADVQINGPVLPEGGAKLIQEVISSLLYARRQVPCLMDDLNRMIQVRRPVNSKSRCEREASHRRQDGDLGC